MFLPTLFFLNSVLDINVGFTSEKSVLIILLEPFFIVIERGLSALTPYPLYTRMNFLRPFLVRLSSVGLPLASTGTLSITSNVTGVVISVPDSKWRLVNIARNNLLTASTGV